MNKPIAPKAPRKPVEPKQTTKLRMYACLEEGNLANFLKEHFPGISTTDITIETEVLRYNLDLQLFEEKIEIYKSALIQYDKEMDNYNEIKRAKEKEKLLKKLKELEK